MDRSSAARGRDGTIHSEHVFSLFGPWCYICGVRKRWWKFWQSWTEDDPITMSRSEQAAATKRKKGAPSKRERELCEAIRDAADDVTKATDYAQGYMARAALIRAMQSLNEWAMAGRPHA